MKGECEMTTEKREEPKPNGTLGRVLQFGQLLVIGAILPWGVWVTGQIYGLNAFNAECRQWRSSREKAQVATVTDVELARLRVKEDIMATINSKLDTILVTVNALDVKLTRHEAAQQAKP